MECRKRLALIFLASSIACLPAGAREAANPFFMAGGVADAPTGFDAFCIRDRVSCLAGHPDRKAENYAIVSPEDRLSGDTAALFRPAMVENVSDMPVLVTALPSIEDEKQAWYPVAEIEAGPVDRAARWSMLRTVNSQVNRAVVQRYDSQFAGEAEFWQRPDFDKEGFGDCEDIAIEKRMRLIEAGYPADELFFAVAYVRRFGLHVVLVARLDDGDYVLDSLSPHVAVKSEVRYSWLRVQSAADPLKWHRVILDRPAPLQDGAVRIAARASGGNGL